MHALFNCSFLSLPHPRLEAVREDAQKLGCASAVGSNAIQLVCAVGFEVLTTALEEKTSKVVKDVTAQLDVSECVGIFQAAGLEESIVPCLEIAKKERNEVFVVTTTPLQGVKIPEGLNVKMVFGDGPDNILPIWEEEYLPQTLIQRGCLVASEPLVLVTKGLESIQEGFNLMRKGVSAGKVVVIGE
ncbi:GroES-like protein [Penicillium argentinense]|uniref:GroES-like protein n=1 Tax=Penicillium argentinense TaxID=1131581 RepID=A0A9W9JYB3_9EURO|nr:GroES-like protein [Penicillium argentinense]KAJ5086068.1 GroES-like protein [Penicillium argentinense]